MLQDIGKMTDNRTCDKTECSITFDIDNDEGVIIAMISGTGTWDHEYFCSSGHIE